MTIVRLCAICRSAEGVRQFAVTVDGDELRAVAELCADHGDQHLLNVGRVLGELFHRRSDEPEGVVRELERIRAAAERLSAAAVPGQDCAITLSAPGLLDIVTRALAVLR